MKLTLQLAPAASVVLDRVNEPALTDCVPLQVPAWSATIALLPAGNVSTNPTPVSPAAFGLVMVTVPVHFCSATIFRSGEIDATVGVAMANTLNVPDALTEGA